MGGTDPAFEEREPPVVVVFCKPDTLSITSSYLSLQLVSYLRPQTGQYLQLRRIQPLQKIPQHVCEIALGVPFPISQEELNPRTPGGWNETFCKSDRGTLI